MVYWPWSTMVTIVNCAQAWLTMISHGSQLTFMVMVILSMSDYDQPWLTMVSHGPLLTFMVDLGHWKFVHIWSWSTIVKMFIGLRMVDHGQLCSPAHLSIMPLYVGPWSTINAKVLIKWWLPPWLTINLQIIKDKTGCTVGKHIMKSGCPPNFQFGQDFSEFLEVTIKT